MTAARLGAIATGILLTHGLVLAHHAYIAEFDTTKPVKVTGVVTKLEWSNPHIWIYLDVKDDKGNITHWGCETLAPSNLRRKGWEKDSVKPGDQITVTVAPRKDGKPFGTLSGYRIVVNGKELDVKL